MKRPSAPLLLILGFVFIAFGWAMWIQTQASKYQSDLGPEIREKYGFSSGSPYIKAGNENIEVFTIHPKVNGALYEAGFRDGDIVTSHTITNFYKILAESQNKQIRVNIVDGGDGPPIKQRQSRTITFEGL